ncbi:MAG: PIN domain-containing protein [Planctomycetia bacterium]|nr:PIN domain-containing protein [Planctomycetia bacterium]
MKVLVDTPVWSLALRRKRGALSPAERAAVLGLRELITAGRVILIGPVRQEILSGIEDSAAFERIRDQLAEFPNEPLDRADDEEAARCFNRLAARGIAGSSTDTLICAVALNRQAAIFTRDRDFERYRAVLPITLHA